MIIATYNRAALLREAISSVLTQSYADFEIIVVDDGSTDATREVLESFDDPRLRFVHQANAGRSRARNVALGLARGELISFLDSDDTYLPQKLERQVSFLDAHPGFAMVYTAATCVDEDGRWLSASFPAEAQGRIYAELAFFRPLTVALPTVMLRAMVLERIGGFDETMERFEDTDLWRRVAKDHLIGAMREVTCRIRTHAGNRLETQDARSIAAAVDRYVAKVLRDDKDQDRMILEAGAQRLYRYYARAMFLVPGFESLGRELAAKAAGFFQPCISIVIPVYNGADHLVDAINSALAQSYPNVEIIVVNDGSNDGGATEAIALGYGPRIRYVSKPNGGVASALNRGIREMKGDWFAWLSHDDLFLPDKLERQVVQLSEQPEPGRCICYGDYEAFTGSDPTGTRVRMPHVAPEDFRHFITTQNILHGCTLLVPRAALAGDPFDERLRTTQDYDLWFRLASAWRFVHLPEVLVRARAHPGQGTNRMKDIVLEECNALLGSFADALTDAELSRASSRSPMRGRLELAQNLHDRGFLGAARQTLGGLRRRMPGEPDVADHIEAMILDLWREREEAALAARQHAAVQAEQAARSEEAARALTEMLRERDELLARNEALATQLEQQAAEARRLEVALSRSAERVAELQSRMEMLLGSTSWRLTWPLRRVTRLLAPRRDAEARDGTG